jgi:transglutaminase-like putative cysteine protease
MRIRVGFELGFDLPAPTPMLLLLYIHPSRQASILKADHLQFTPVVPITTFYDGYSNQCARIVAPAGKLTITNEAIVQDDGLPDRASPNARQHPVEELPTDVLPFLLASRYCEVDEMTSLAWELFGKTSSGWSRVQAIVDWVHHNVEFGYAYASSTKTAGGVCRERKGVCRDFMHLAVTFCRCMNIPARYATGYLGDIGVPFNPAPMDFSAWFEVYLDHQWWTFDARHNKARIGRVLMARGRDAVDAALTTSFGTANLEKFVVWTDEVKE